MRHWIRACALAAIFMACAGGSRGSTITFESANREGDILTSLTSPSGVTLNFSGAVLAKKNGGWHDRFRAADGLEAAGLSGSRAGVQYERLPEDALEKPADLGNWFITDSPGTLGWGENQEICDGFFPGTVTIQFSEAVKDVGFWALDIDAGKNERLTAKAYFRGAVVPDGIETWQGQSRLQDETQFIDFETKSLIDRVVIRMDLVAEDGVFGPRGKVGVGIDNLSFHEVPEPSALALWAGLGTVGLLGWRRRRGSSA